MYKYSTIKYLLGVELYSKLRFESEYKLLDINDKVQTL
jgi:hypothetical protein